MARTIRQHPAKQVAVTVAVAATVGVAVLLSVNVSADGEENVDGIIRRVVHHTSRTLVATRATRDLRAGTVSGKHQGWMTVETAVNPAGVFSWNVITEGGSERTRQKVFRELLQAEAQAWRDGDRDAAELSLTNYRFTALPSRSGLIQLRVTPLRADPKLIDGVLTVKSDGSPVRLEGKLAKSPSFWVKSVTVVRHYARIGGVVLPTSLESLADLKMFGQATFTMRYRYSEVAGKNVTQTVATAPLVGPSAEILALHTAGAKN